jgi:anti-sigma B factor antagonist
MIPVVPQPFQIEIEDAAKGTIVLKVTGELDLAVAGELQTTLDKTAPEDVVLLDLSGCEFIDSTGLAVVLHAKKRQDKSGGRLALFSASDQVERVLEISGLIRDGLVFADREQALSG